MWSGRGKKGEGRRRGACLQSVLLVGGLSELARKVLRELVAQRDVPLRRTRGAVRALAHGGFCERCQRTTLPRFLRAATPCSGTWVRGDLERLSGGEVLGEEVLAVCELRGELLVRAIALHLLEGESEMCVC